MKWEICYKVISPTDYHTPSIPREYIRVEGKDEDDAWENFLSEPGTAPREWYKKINIEILEKYEYVIE